MTEKYELFLILKQKKFSYKTIFFFYFAISMIRFHLFKEEDYQNLGTYRRIQKENQNSPTKQQSLDALTGTGNNISSQNVQLVNAESKHLEQCTLVLRVHSRVLIRSLAQM